MRRKKMAVSRDGDVPPTMGVSLVHRLRRIVECGGPTPLWMHAWVVMRDAYCVRREQGAGAGSEFAGCRSRLLLLLARSSRLVARSFFLACGL